MVDANTGSVVGFITQLAGDKVPSNLSGTQMNFIIEQQAQFVEQYTGVAVSLDDIPGKYQGPLTDLTLAQVLRAIDVQEGGINSVSLGELSLSEGNKGSNSDTADMLIGRARKQLLELGRKVRVYKVWGAS